MNAADFLVHPDDFGDVAVICPQCGAPSYIDIATDVTLGALIRIASDHAVIHADIVIRAAEARGF